MTGRRAAFGLPVAFHQVLPVQGACRQALASGHIAGRILMARMDEGSGPGILTPLYSTGEQKNNNAVALMEWLLQPDD